ncbi:hypothetical protein SAMN05421504_108253 [Amycolatopsis xylanica]|uniref:Uncharacterized protein n=1 Tax=Amycolatopsis xylanica TaxID=589385 RepID=A0A1H3PJQ2_9PSEU|nr:hypothetical protein SAMN05421504_108253 [Amycolatopsis xylanica]
MVGSRTGYDPAPDEKSLFLAGGMRHCPVWRPAALAVIAACALPGRLLQAS